MTKFEPLGIRGIGWRWVRRVGHAIAAHGREPGGGL